MSMIVHGERPPEAEAQYQCERASLTKDDYHLACLLSAIERDRSSIPRAHPIPLYEQMAFALKDRGLRQALIDALQKAN